MLACVTLSACSMLAPIKEPEKNQFFFDVSSIQVKQSQRSDKTILVSKPFSAPGYGSYRMPYIEKPFEISYYTRNRWVDTPAKMLQPLIVQALQDTHYFRAVTAAPFVGQVDNRIDTNLIYLRQNLTKQPSTIELAIQMQIVNIKNQKVIASRLFQTEEVVLMNNPYSSVLAINQAMERFLHAMTKFVLYNTMRSPEQS